MNAGASAVNINILQGDQSVFTRDISMGGNAYTEAVQKELNLPFESAEQVKKGIPVDSATFEKRPMLHAVTDNVLLEIQKTFDFFKATVSSEQIDRIVLRRGVACGWLQRHAARQIRCARRGLQSIFCNCLGREEAVG